MNDKAAGYALWSRGKKKKFFSKIIWDKCFVFKLREGY
jgi:hypothetical protein